MKRRQFAAQSAAAFAVAAAAPLVFAQQDRTVRILVGFPPGGSADVVARVLAEKMRVSLGQNVIIDNKPGAAGRLALGELRRAAPDGTTLVFSPSGAMVIHPWLYSNLGYDPAKDFTPIALGSTFDFAVTAGPGAPAGDPGDGAGVDEGQPGQGQLRHLGRGHGAALCRTTDRPGGRRADDARGLSRWRAGCTRPDRRPGAADGRHGLGNHRAPPRRQGPHPRGDGRAAQPRAARRADAEGVGHQRDGRCVLRPLWPAGDVARSGRCGSTRPWPMRCACPTCREDLFAGAGACACRAEPNWRPSRRRI